MNVLNGSVFLSPAAFIGRSGYTEINYGYNVNYISCVIQLSDGKYLASGYLGTVATSEYFYIISRFNNDGTFDTSFGVSGTVIVPHFPGCTFDQGTGGLAIQTDNKIVILGTLSLDPNNPIYGPYDLRWGLVRLNYDGTVDTSFGTSGYVITDFTSYSIAWGLIIQSDGKLLAVGEVWAADLSDTQFGLSRYNTDGSLDNTFGTGGKVTTSFPRGWGTGRTVAIQSDGKIVMAGGDWNTAGSIQDVAVARYNTDGTLDNTFGTSGKATFNDGGSTYDGAWSLVLQSDGKILLGCGGSIGSYGVAYAQLILRLNTNGTLDNTFGTGGAVQTNLAPNGTIIRETSFIGLQSDGKIVAFSSNKYINEDVHILRFNTDGTLDTTFGINGEWSWVLTNQTIYVNDPFGGLVDVFDRIVLAGSHSFVAPNTTSFILRVTANGSFDTTFGDLV